MDKIHDKNKSKPLSPNDLRVSGGGKKTPMIEITNLSGMLDCENTLLMSDSTAGCFIMPNKLPLHLGGDGRHWQKALQTATLSLALSFFIAAPVCAADTPPVPTLDRVKAENTTFINSAHSTYTLTAITDPYADLPENAIKVNISDKEYYYTPNAGDDTNALKTIEQ